MHYFQYPDAGFIASPLLQLRVHDYIACGDQWCCDPAKVQIESVWFHIVPTGSVGTAQYYICDAAWDPSWELRQITGPMIRPYACPAQ